MIIQTIKNILLEQKLEFSESKTHQKFARIVIGLFLLFIIVMMSIAVITLIVESPFTAIAIFLIILVVWSFFVLCK